MVSEENGGVTYKLRGGLSQQSASVERVDFSGFARNRLYSPEESKPALESSECITDSKKPLLSFCCRLMMVKLAANVAKTICGKLRGNLCAASRCAAVNAGGLVLVEAKHGLYTYTRGVDSAADSYIPI